MEDESETPQIYASQEGTRGQEEWRGLKEKWRGVRGNEYSRQRQKELETAACVPAHGKEIRFGLSTLYKPCPARSSVHSLIHSVIDGASPHPLSSTE